MTRRVQVLALGGTIAMVGEGDGGIRPTLGAAELVDAVPELSQVAQVDADSFRQLPGAHLQLRDVVELSDRIARLVAQGFDGVVVTQGTDTIEEIAFGLDLLSEVSAPVVVTGAMRGPEQAGADGPANLLNAVRIAASDEARHLGVLVTMNDEIHAARFVSKRDASVPSAFRSLAVGPIGRVAEGRVRIPVRPTGRVHVDLPAGSEPPPVTLVTATVSDDGRMLRQLAHLGYAGVVIAGFGVGHLPDRYIDDVTALAQQLPVVLASRTGAGETFRSTYGFAGSESDVLGRGVIAGGALDPLKAQVLLSLALAAGWSSGRTADAFESLSG